MMLAMGCIQSLQCNADSCPTGITTHQAQLVKGLDVKDKRQRVANFQAETIKSVAEILAAAGLNRTEELNRKHVFRRISQTQISSYQNIYPALDVACLLKAPYPQAYEEDMQLANPEMFNCAACAIKD
jgi:hypothetical protein